MSPLYLFNAGIYSQRRRQLMDQFDNDLLLFLGNENSPVNYEDNYYPFRQDSSFLYYAGLNMPHLAMVIDCSRQKTILFGDNPTIDDIVWMGPQHSMPELAEKVGINDISSFANLSQIIQAAREKGQKIHYLPPYRSLNKIRLSRLLGKSIEQVEQEVSLPLVKAVIAQREIKGPEEIEEMAKAVTLSGQMHEAVMQRSKAGLKESEMVGVLHEIASAADCQLAYTAILTINGQTLHNHHYHNTMKEGQLLLGDFGAASTMQYAGDITRTCPVSKRFTNQQKEIYQIVLDAEVNAIESLKPGLSYREVHLNASKYIVDGLKDLGLMKGDTDEAVQEGAHALFFPHGLGHMIGLDVHDMENFGEDHVGYGPNYQRSSQFGLKSLRLAKELKAGFVLTVEPGIYFIPELMDRWKTQKNFEAFINYSALEAYRNFGGIRIEDNVLITDSGFEILGEPITKSIDEVEALKA
jgi:Xaa-Pro aminopeptidase